MQDKATVSRHTKEETYAAHAGQGEETVNISQGKGLQKKQMDDHTPWCYAIVHGSQKRKHILQELEPKFATFIHQMNIYKREGKRIVHKEKPTITGLIFIQGDPDEIKKYANEKQLELFLRNDCATRRVAIIPHSVMCPLIGITKMEGVQIMFTQHDGDFYAKDKVLVRGISGIHTGLEGYIVRFHRDRMLVMSLGNSLTVAVNGVSKSNFVSVEDIQIAREKGIIQ